MRGFLVLLVFALGLWLLPASTGHAVVGPQEQVEDVRNTKHNLSAFGPSAGLKSTPVIPGQPEPGREVFSPETTEVCVFCHTPHGANPAAAAEIRAPLWNRNLSSAQYTLYDQVWSKSFEGELHPGAPTGYSRLCLSCHDGTIALGSVINKPGSGGFRGTALQMQGPLVPNPCPGQQGPFSGTIPLGNPCPPSGGALGGDTRRLGTDLTNDHPISFVFDTALAIKDGELTDPGPPIVQSSTSRIGDPTPISPLRRAEGIAPGVFDSIQCTSCHNPHGVTYPKFLRAGRFDHATERMGGGATAPAGQIICMFCHDKPGWLGSSHQNPPGGAVRNLYPVVDGSPDPVSALANPANGYDFDGQHTVAEYACRNCHDPHTAQGAKRLHREGVDAFTNAKDAIENTCFLCHSPNAERTPVGTLPAGDPTSPSFPRFVSGRPAPDIFTEFNKDVVQGNCVPAAPNYDNCGSAMNLTLAQGHEPVFVSRPQEGVELASPSPRPYNEFPPGTAAADQRHIECVDCHNPHQVVATNRLKGMKGIDINGSVVGAGVPGSDREPFVYEVCLRCHGNSYVNLFRGDRYPDDTHYRSDPRDLPPQDPKLSYRGFSNKRKEFDPNTPDFAPDHTMQPVNAAFHPVAAPGRNGSYQLCKQLQAAFGLDCGPPPADMKQTTVQAQTALRNLTIQCTDCHNSEKTGIVRGPVTFSNLRPTDRPSLYTDPETDPIGPHGSKFVRILRNAYLTDARNPTRCFETGNPTGCGASDGADPRHWDKMLLCFQCHDRRAFEGVGNMTDASWTKFFGRPAGGDTHWNGNLHIYHMTYTGAICHECHYNVHSNVEAVNTAYGDRGDPNNCIGGVTDIGAGLTKACTPPDDEDGMPDGVADTHLINFGPQADGNLAIKPWWFYDLTDPTKPQFRCFVTCHGNIMNTCAYQVDVTLQASQSSSTWCAGGQTPG